MRGLQHQWRRVENRSVAKRKTGRAAAAASPESSNIRSVSAGLTLAVLALILLVVVVYAPVRDYPYVNWDDADYVVGNRHVLAGLTAETLAWAATANTAANWHPVTMLSHAMIVEWFGDAAGPQHVANLVLHLTNTVLLFVLLNTLTGSRGRSFFVAALFGVHPLHVESVAWVSQRKDVLSTFFWLTASIFYLRYVRRSRRTDYLPVMLCFALAVMSKPMAVTFPIALILIDLWPLGRVVSGAQFKRVILEKIPLFAIAVAAGIVTLVFQSRAGAVPDLQSLDMATRVAAALHAYVAYLGQTFWPVHLSPFYPPEPVPIWMSLSAAMALAGVTAAVVRLRHTLPFLLMGWLWFLIILLPTIGLLKVGEQSRADRYMYLPLVGILIMLAWGIPELLKRWTRQQVVLPLLVGLVIAAAVPVARAQVSRWSGSEALWQHAVDVTKDNRRAYENLAQALRERNQLAEAYANYERALALSSPTQKAVNHNSMGLVLVRQGRAQEAVAQFRAAVAIDRNFAEAQTNLGNALSADGRPDEAIGHFTVALGLTPESAETQLGMAGALLSMRRPGEARSHYQEAVRLNPGMAEAHSGLGTALAQLGDLDGSIRELTESLRLNPNLVNANLNLGLILAQRGQSGDRERAIRYLEAALRLAPSLAVARDTLVALRGEIK